MNSVSNRFSLRLGVILTIFIFLFSCLKEKEEMYPLFLGALLLMARGSGGGGSCALLGSASLSSPPGQLLFAKNLGAAGEADFMTPQGVQRLSYRKFGSAYLVGGDMLFPAPADTENLIAPEYTESSVGIQGSTFRWPSKQVNYTISTADSVMVQKAIAHVEKFTDFRFTLSATDNYINFKNDGAGKGCSSYVGMMFFTPQNIQVEDLCGVGATVHEIGHALGLFHEQSRNDRDKYVNIDLTKVIPGYEGNYKKANSAYDLIRYDFNSIMHYGSYDFAQNPSIPIMTKINGDIIYPNRDGFSSCDVDGLKKLYTLN